MAKILFKILMIILLYENYELVGSDSERNYYDYRNRKFNTETLTTSTESYLVTVDFDSEEDPTTAPTIVVGEFYTDCDGTTKRSYIYDGLGGSAFTVEETPNSTDCGYVAPCDIAITNVLITPDSNFDIEDATLRVYATTGAGIDATIVFSLDGTTYQISPIFTALWAGEHTVYAKDTNNCVAQQTVTIPYAPFGCKYQVEFIDEFGFTTFARIYQRDYEGPTYERLGGYPAVVIKLSGDGDDKFSRIKGSTCQLTIQAESNFEYLPIFSGDEREHRIDVWKKVEGIEQLIWRGYVLADFHQEPYDQDEDYFVTITASDGIGTLKKRLYKDAEGGPAKGQNTQFEVIRACLRKLNLGLPIYSAVNIYADIMETGPDDDPFVQAVINQEVYQTDSGAPFDCLKVLDENLKPYGAQIRLSEGAWHIIEIPSAGQEYVRRKFTNRGEFLFSEDHNPLLTITGPRDAVAERLFFINRSQQLEVRTGHQQESVYVDFSNYKNIIKSGAFEPRDFQTTGTLKYWSGNASIRGYSPDAGTPSIYPQDSNGSVPSKVTKASKSNAGVVFTNALTKGILEAAPDFVTNRIEGNYPSGATVLWTENNKIYQSSNAYGTTPFIFDAAIAEGRWVLIYGGDSSQNDFTVKPVSYIQSDPIFLQRQGNISYKLDVSFFGNSLLHDRVSMTVAFEVKAASYWLNDKGVWTPTRFVFYSLQEFTNQSKVVTISATSDELPEAGNLTITLYQPIVPGNNANAPEDYTLTFKSVVFAPLYKSVDLPEGYTHTQEINENYSETGDLIELIHADFPPGINSPLFSRGGISAFVVAPYRFFYAQVRQVGGGLTTPGNSRLVNTGTSPDIGDILLHDELYIQTTGSDVLQGPYEVIGFYTGTNDLVINKPKSGDTPGPAGVAIFTKTKRSFLPTKTWNRRGESDDLPLSDLLLQQVANNFSRPTQQISGTLLGKMNFTSAIYDPNNPGRVFLYNGGTYNVHRQQWDGQFIELVLPQVVDPGLMAMTFENGEDRIFENMDLKIDQNGG